MRGKIILVPLEKITEGMQIIFAPNKTELYIVTILDEPTKFRYSGGNSETIDTEYLGLYKQLNIEYLEEPEDKEVYFPIGPYPKQLPILSSQWQEILDKNLINTEVEFELDEYNKVYGYKTAKVILPVKEGVCSKNGIKREGESCTLNNNCIYPECLVKEESWDDIQKKFIKLKGTGASQLPSLMFGDWLLENYNPPTKKK